MTSYLLDVKPTIQLKNELAATEPEEQPKLEAPEQAPAPPQVETVVETPTMSAPTEPPQVQPTGV